MSFVLQPTFKSLPGKQPDGKTKRGVINFSYDFSLDPVAPASLQTIVVENITLGGSAYPTGAGVSFDVVTSQINTTFPSFDVKCMAITIQYTKFYSNYVNLISAVLHGALYIISDAGHVIELNQPVSPVENGTTGSGAFWGTPSISGVFPIAANSDSKITFKKLPDLIGQTTQEVSFMDGVLFASLFNFDIAPFVTQGNC